MKVVDLDSRRIDPLSAAAARCSCGSEWFVLRGRATDPDVAQYGAVTFSTSGSITGYIGQAQCAECERAWAPVEALPDGWRPRGRRGPP